MKIRDKYSIIITHDPKHRSITDKDIDLIKELIGNKELSNDILEEIVGCVKVYFNKQHWKATFISFGETVFFGPAYHIKLRKDNNKNYAIKIIIQEKLFHKGDI